jgi:hypothetical protein
VESALASLATAIAELEQLIDRQTGADAHSTHAAPSPTIGAGSNS